MPALVSSGSQLWRSNFNCLVRARRSVHLGERRFSDRTFVKPARARELCGQAFVAPARPADREVCSTPDVAQPALRSFDFLVLGSGVAGLTYALKVAEFGSVAVVTKERASEGCTQYAQGGVSAVLAELDSTESHINDTLRAGDFINDLQAVEVVCREGPAEVLKLAELGAKFTRSRNGSLHLTREGGHSARRVVHAEDATGLEIERALLAAGHAHPSITFFEHHLALDLVLDPSDGPPKCFGADVLDQRSCSMARFVAPVTLLATGGAGQVYPITTNPRVTTGDGMAMAARANAKMHSMEFVQFHPTGFFSETAPATLSQTFLISEAVRGEGGLLFNKAGESFEWGRDCCWSHEHSHDQWLSPRPLVQQHFWLAGFMPKYDNRLELAPRDVVARAIQDEMLCHGDSHVLLDISHCQPGHVRAHFPNIAARCLSHGVDITSQPIPVAPAAHYMCGGVQTGLSGETSIAGLYAAGEVACTGVHGANRLASNSLLEGLVFASRAVEPSVLHAESVFKNAGRALHYASTRAPMAGLIAPSKLRESTIEWINTKRLELKSLMWDHAGILRRTQDMGPALQRLNAMAVEAEALLQSYGAAIELVELRNLVTVGRHIMEAALVRTQSCGGHFIVGSPKQPPSSPWQPKPGQAKPGRAWKDSGQRIRGGGGSDVGSGVRGGSPPRPRPSKREIALRSQREERAE